MVVATFNQKKSLVGAFSMIKIILRVGLFEALLPTYARPAHGPVLHGGLQQPARGARHCPPTPRPPHGRAHASWTLRLVIIMATSQHTSPVIGLLVKGLSPTAVA